MPSFPDLPASDVAAAFHLGRLLLLLADLIWHRFRVQEGRGFDRARFDWLYVPGRRPLSSPTTNHTTQKFCALLQQQAWSDGDA